MCPLCLVPYPIILCPCSKNQCSPIVLLTCSTSPMVHNTPCCLPSSLANFSPFFSLFVPLVCSTSTYNCILSLNSPSFFFSLSTHFYFTLNTFLQPCITAFQWIKLYLSYSQFFSYIFSCLLPWWVNAGGPNLIKDGKQREHTALLLCCSSCTFNPPIITLSSLLQCWSCLGTRAPSGL